MSHVDYKLQAITRGKHRKKFSILKPFQRLNERRKFRYKTGDGTAPKIIVEPPTPSPGASFTDRNSI